jgi:acyl-CoA thioesterase FadM
MWALWDSKAVMRTNTAEVYLPHSSACEAVDISVWLTRVGNSSWGIGFEISDAGTEAVVARMSTTMVNVDAATLSRSEPVPHAAALKAMAAGAPSASAGSDDWVGGFVAAATAAAEDESALQAARGGGTGGLALGAGAAARVFRFKCEMPVRHTDTDGNGHVNNAIYVLLAEEVRALMLAAAQQGGLAVPESESESESALLQHACASRTAVCHVGYIDQCRPPDVLQASAAFIPSATGLQAFVIRFDKGPDRIADVVLAVEPPPQGAQRPRL